MIFYCYRFIIAKSDDIDFVDLFSEIAKITNNEDEPTMSGTRLPLYFTAIQRLLNSMDSEYDQNVAKGLLAALLPRAHLYKLGIKPDRIIGRLSQILNASKEAENAIDAADGLLVCRLRDRLNRIDQQEKVLNEKLRHCALSERTKSDLKADLELLEQRRQESSALLAREDSDSRRKFRQSRKRVAKELLEENRVKRRRLGAGRPRAMGEEEEDYMARCIAEKSTAHGGRHNTTMYLNHRVKKRHFLSIVNYSLLQKGKKMKRSPTTVYNHSKPNNVRSKAAKQHLGKWLVCCKKPPKTEDDSVETTHHQRAHVRNAKMELALQSPESSLVCSMDDKAYLRPGTDGMFSNKIIGSLLVCLLCSSFSYFN